LTFRTLYGAVCHRHDANQGAKCSRLSCTVATDHRECSAELALKRNMVEGKRAIQPEADS
jgi:hypothetical protein